MEIEAPTFNSLNKPQKRALILRDQLRYTDARHLDSFIDGLTDDEPPTYRTTNGVTQPPLQLVTLKSTATRFDLGNVLFPEEYNAVHHVYLTVEDGRFEMHTEEGLPEEEANLQSVPIHGFIAKTMVPMFKDKVQAILARQNKINEARRRAFNAPVQPPTHFHEGQTLARLDPAKTQQNKQSALTKRPKKRKPGDTVIKHPCNKRTRIGLDSIPDTMKSAAFNTIPEHLKVDLFNTISRTAFPHFDNLMVASWNVVAVYSAVGTDFPELHKAVVELKHVLSDFDEAFGLKIDRADVRYRAEFDPAMRGEGDGQRALGAALVPAAVQDGVEMVDQSNGKAPVDEGVEQEEDDNGVPGGSEQNLTTQHSMAPPRLAPSANPEDGEKSEEDSFEDLITPGASSKDASRSISRSHREPSTAAPIHSTHSSPAPHPPPATPSPCSSTTSPELARRREEYASSISKTNKHISAAAAATLRESSEPTPPPKQKNKKTLADLTTAQLRKKYRERKAGLVQQHGSLGGAPAAQREVLRQIEEMVRAREREEGEGVRGVGANPYAGRQQQQQREKSLTSHSIDESAGTGTGTGTSDPVPPRGRSLVPSSIAGSPRRLGTPGTLGSSPHRRPIPGVGMAGAYLGVEGLGTSLLGARKQMGRAPVADMVPGGREGGGRGSGYADGGGNGSGNGSGVGGEARRGSYGPHGRF